MVRYLSDEWIAALDAAAQTSERLRDTTRGRHLVVQHVITDAPQGEVSYHVVIDDGAVSFRRGAASEPTVTFRQDYDTAVAVARGQLSAQAAFLNGTMSVRGDLTKLALYSDALTGIDGALTSVRQTTDF